MSIQPKTDASANLTPRQVSFLRALLAPLFRVLHGQHGTAAALTLHHGDGSETTFTVARLRKLRRAAWPSEEYEALCDPRTNDGDGHEERRRLGKRRIYAEPTVDGSPTRSPNDC